MRDQNPQAPVCGTGATVGSLRARSQLGSQPIGRGAKMLTWDEPEEGLEKRTFGALLRNVVLVRFVRNYALLRRLSARS
jgi:hypothetical protein